MEAEAAGGRRLRSRRPLTLEEFVALPSEAQADHLKNLQERFEAMSPNEKAYILEASRARLADENKSLVGSVPTTAMATPIQTPPPEEIEKEEERENEVKEEEEEEEDAKEADEGNDGVVVTAQPSPAGAAPPSDAAPAQNNDNHRKKIHRRRRVPRGNRWRTVRSLHFKNGHWSIPIRYDQAMWKSYATTDRTYGPWCASLTLISVDVRGIRQKENALDLLDSIADTNPDFCALEGVNGAFASMLMKHSGIRKSYWVQLGENLTSPSAKLRNVGSIITLARIPPVEARALDIGLGVEALLCLFVVNGISLKIAATSARRCDQDILNFEVDECERREEIRHLVEMIELKERSSDSKKGHSSVLTRGLVLLGDCGCPCQQHLETQTPPDEDSLMEERPLKEHHSSSQQLFKVAGKPATRSHGEGAWMTSTEVWSAEEWKEDTIVDNFDSDEYCAVAVKLRSKIKRPISASPENQDTATTEVADIDLNHADDDACLIS